MFFQFQGSDKHAYEWQRCLDNCCRMIKDANNIFNSVSSSAVCNEIIKSTQGSEYVSGMPIFFIWGSDIWYISIIFYNGQNFCDFCLLMLLRGANSFLLE